MLGRLALVPLLFVSACSYPHLSAPPGQSMRIEIPAQAKYRVAIGDPEPGMGQTTIPLVMIVAGAIAAADGIDSATSGDSRNSELTAMIRQSGQDPVALFAKDLQSKLRTYGDSVTIMDPSGRPYTAATTNTPASSPVRITDAMAGDPLKGDNPPQLPFNWVLEISNIKIGYDAKGITTYFEPFAIAKLTVVRAPSGSVHKPIPVTTRLTNVPAYRFFTFKDIMADPKHAIAGLTAVSADLASFTAAAIEVKPKK